MTFITYRSYNDKGIAIHVYEQLCNAGLTVQWEDSTKLFETDFVFNEFINIYYVKLRQEDFEKADEIMEQSVLESNEQPTDDYYLYSFTDKELIDVLKHPEEWNEFDTLWAKRLLDKRGVEVRQKDILQHKDEKLKELRKPWTIDKIWLLGVIALLLFGLYFWYFLATSGVIILGLYIFYSKKKLPGGERVIAFSEGDRKLARIVIAAGIISTLYLFLLYFGILNYEKYFLGISLF